ncbi:transketolase [Alkalibacterium putridalgicola]|uniref:Transketolase n=1 Tax=Alkalibacterium putridalgicola TaxID=426703 RepID=A0A1H7PVC1_9LACT|nr:transketolase [Alkalibacterium putridalgicola]GEK88132.1 transketolase [Alkalibacterium putridalgicola]SEL39780.1 transketolase [Alkalibacterium putridalgicola]
MFDKTDQMAVDTIRTLSIDGVQKANSGHPGLPMGAAPMAYTLWTRHLNVNPKNPRWFDRDRFVLSAGHGSMMLYSLLHLSGYKVSVDDLKNFRQLEGNTPGHPEVHVTDGVEATTGPLGQGIANAVGMAMAEAHLSATYNKEGHSIVDHYTYALCGDGDLQEGVSQEAASLAGHLKLGKLVMLYDSNDIQLDGPTSKAFTEDVGQRFEAYGWEHILVEDGNDLDAIDKAITKAKESTDKPTLIEIKTVIGFGAPNAGTHNVHGAPLGPEGVEAAKKAYGWEGEDFFVPEEVAKRFKEHMIDKGDKLESEWNKKLEDYRNTHSDLAAQFEDSLSGKLPENWDKELPVFSEGDGAAATRSTSGEVLNAIAKAVPNLWGGSADLSGSNKTTIDGVEDFQAGQYEGRNIWYGVREFAMAAALNGIMLHGGTKSYVSTFFVFTDYLRPAVRLAALSEIPAIYVMTHDSIAVGEDGPTHEPVEQLSSFRGMHNLSVVRPADGNEVAAAWEVALTSQSRPTMLVLTRQNLPVLAGSKELARENLKKGAYVLSPADKETPDGILIATGSEVSLAMDAQKELKAQGKDVSVVSMPSFDLFEDQSDEYKESVLPSAVKNRVAIEMGSSFGWHKYVKDAGKVMAIDKFGASGNGEAVVEAYGFTPENVVNTFLSLNS